MGRDSLRVNFGFYTKDLVDAEDRFFEHESHGLGLKSSSICWRGRRQLGSLPWLETSYPPFGRCPRTRSSPRVVSHACGG
jgi:hypothetical protein